MILKCIGVGGFSKVYLTRDKADGTFYAAKFIEKAKLKDK
jgi:serum/glucocorticoid-regulated kinase 2